MPFSGGGLLLGVLLLPVFESQTLVVAELKNRVDRGDDSSTVPMAAAQEMKNAAIILSASLTRQSDGSLTRSFLLMPKVV